MQFKCLICARSLRAYLTSWIQKSWENKLFERAIFTAPKNGNSFRSGSFSAGKILRISAVINTPHSFFSRSEKMETKRRDNDVWERQKNEKYKWHSSRTHSG
jgi:hypothetical protein